MKKIAVLISSWLLLSGFSPFTSSNSFIQKGNDSLKNKKYEEALKYYDKAAKELPDHPGVQYNRGIALYRLKKMVEAEKAFLDGTKTTDLDLKAKSYYNLGNLQYQNKKYKGAASSYSRALQLNPEHLPSKWNLELALRKIKEEEKKKKEDQKKKDKKQNKKKDQQNQEKDKQSDKQKENNNKKQNQENKDQQPKKNKPQDKKQKQNKERQKEQMRSVLDALERSDKNLQKRKARIMQRGHNRRPQKDW